MVKIVSYRQKLKELAKIYRINKVFDQNLKFTTYDIEIILLKNHIALPSTKRGYISHKFFNEIFKPFYEILKNLFIHMNNFINVWKTKTKSRLEEVIRIDGPLIARAFPGRAAILIHLLNFNEEKIEVVYEKYGSLKINHYVPGTRIPIKCESEFFSSKKKHDRILNLAWHIPNEINAYMKENSFLGEIINIIE